MKFIILCGFICFMSTQTFAQHDPDKLLYFQKIEKFRKMKSTGAFLTVTGSVLTIVGFVTLLNATIEETTYGGGQTQTRTTGNPELGAAAFLLGIGGLGSGIPLWAIGAHNQRKYTQKLEGVSLRLTRQKEGLTLAYRF